MWVSPMNRGPLLSLTPDTPRPSRSGAFFVIFLLSQEKRTPPLLPGATSVCACVRVICRPRPEQASSLASHKWTWSSLDRQRLTLLCRLRAPTNPTPPTDPEKNPPSSPPALNPSPLGPGWLPRLPCRLRLPHVAMRLGPTDLS